MSRVRAMAWCAGAALAGGAALWMVARLRPRAALARPFSRVRVSHTWHFDAPKDRVFAYWTAASAFPDFLDGVQSVQRLGTNRYLFELKAPAGGRVFWEAVVTRFTKDEEMAWDSDPFSLVQCRGWARFREEGEGSAVDFYAEYGPGASWMAEDMARFLGRELPGLLKRDAVRMKNLIETGSAEL